MITAFRRALAAWPVAALLAASIAALVGFAGAGPASAEMPAYAYDTAACVYDAPARLLPPDTVARDVRGSPSGPGAASLGRSVSVGGDVVAANTEMTTLFRSVGPGEAADIAATGTFNNAAGINVKYFATTADDAATWGNFLNPGESTIITTRVPTSALDGAMFEPRWDGIGPAWILDSAQLGRLNQAMNGISVVR